MKKNIILLICCCFYACKNTKTHHDDVSEKNHLVVEQSFQQENKESLLPIGKKEILNKTKGEKSNYAYLEVINLFKYYDSINGEPPLGFKFLDIPKYNSLYKPTSSDTRIAQDSKLLKSYKEYGYFKLVKMLPKKFNREVLIFEGASRINDYDGNELIINRKDLVVFDAENHKIIDEINLYYDYNDGIVARTKLFFIDESYTIYTRYFSENEEGNYHMSGLSQFSISNSGILKIEKNINEKQEGDKSTFKVGAVVYAKMATYLNVRTLPSTNGNVIAKAYPEDGLKVLEVLEGWIKVSLNNIEGYVSSEFVK